MTKKELLQKMKVFLEGEAGDDTSKKEYWCTPREIAEDVLARFAAFIGVEGPNDAGK